VNTVTEYFLGDALGSVRQLANSSGTVTLAKSYAPYGETRSSVGSGTSPFAYTGEQTDSSGLTYLRSRYYASNTGRFLTRDTWMGDYNRPLSLNKWTYVEANPINWVDPTGRFPFWCKSMNARLGYENCVRSFYNLSAPRLYPVMPPERQEGSPGCWSGPVAYKAPGYLEGYSKTAVFGIGYSKGEELVYDFGTMEKGRFSYETVSLAIEAGLSAMVYHGLVFGFNNVDSIKDKYKGTFKFGSIGASTPYINVGTGVNYFRSIDGIGGELWGFSQYYSVGISYPPIPLDLTVGLGLSTPLWSKSYLKFGGVNKWELMRDIDIGPDSPVWGGFFLPSALMKGHGIVLAYHFSWIYNEIHLESR